MIMTRFPDKNKGDALSHKHVNALNEVGKRSSQIAGFRGPYGMGSAESIPEGLQIVEITKLRADNDDPNETGIAYAGKLCWYDSDNTDGESESSQSERTDQWKTYGNEVNVDGTPFNLTLVVGERYVCFWHGNRHAFVAIKSAAETTQPETTGDCGCSGFLVEGEVDCFGTADSPQSYIVGSLGPFGDVVLEYDDACTWISDVLELDCEEDSSSSGNSSGIGGGN